MQKKTPSEISAEHHNMKAGDFEKNYENYENNKFFNAFTLGRAKIDIEINNLTKMLNIGSKILDVGCGTGDQLKIFEKIGFDAYGLDPAPDMITIAKKNVIDPSKISLGSCEHLPFDNNTFDCVVMVEVLRYFDSKSIDKALEEARRVLKPGGIMFCTFVNRWCLDFFYIFQKFRQITKKNDFDIKNPHCEFFTPGEVEKLLHNFNFKEIKTIGNMFSPIRIIYKLNRKLGEMLAKKIENFDNYISKKKFFKPLSGHLISICKK
tara:strand:+ start:1297 stop:2088 length:792 start_codon:yes stop_codon:yes gene_type:complete